MSSVLNKIADAVTGHHAANTTAAGTNAPLTNNAAMANNAPLGNAAGGVGADLQGTNFSAAPNGALKEGAQMRDTGLAHTQGTLAHGVAGSTTSHPTASGAAKGGVAGALAGHPVAGAAAGAALGHHMGKEHGTHSHLHSSSSSSLHSSNAGALGAGALGAGALAAGTHHNTTTQAGVGSSHVGTGLATGARTTDHQISHDNAMTRSEEHLLVGKEKINVGQAALHKYVTTEHVSTAVPIVRERAVVEREPITDLNRHTAVTGPAFQEAHVAVNLMEERAVAEKEAVAIERVRLRKEVEQTQQYVEADLRKEHIEIVDGTQGKALAGAGVAGAAVGAAKTLESHHQTGLGHNNQLGSTATTDASRRL